MKKLTHLITAILAALILISQFATAPAQAQTSPTSTPSPDCKPADVIKQAAALKSTGDNDKDLDALLKLSDAIAAARALCRGLVFKGTIVSKIIGPVTLEAATYKVTLTTKGYFILKITPKSGDCGFEDGSPYNVGQGEATTGSEILIESKGCTFFMKPDNISAPWTLVFEKME